jgi:phosphonopyruvate decarboxylase
MLDTSKMMACLLDLNYKVFTGVPCSYLKDIINYAINEELYYPSSNEGDAVALAVGMHFGKTKAVILMQNSGLTNAMSPLTSLNPIFKIPVLIFMGNRGGDRDEVQHSMLGGITEKLLENIKIKCEHLSSDMAIALNQIKNANQYIEQTGESFCFLISKDLFEKIEVLPAKQQKITGLKRYKILEILNDNRDKDTIIVTTTGFTSRELFTIEDNPNNMYTVGSMGCASTVALGIALSNKSKKVVVVDGDGAFMMRLSALSMLGDYKPNNLLHVVLDNGSYESTGKQPTQSNKLNIYKCLDVIYDTNLNIASYQAFEDTINEWIVHPKFQSVYVQITAESIEVLGRPRETPEDVKKRLLQQLEVGE